MGYRIFIKSHNVLIIHNSSKDAFSLLDLTAAPGTSSAKFDKFPFGRAYLAETGMAAREREEYDTPVFPGKQHTSLSRGNPRGNPVCPTIEFITASFFGTCTIGVAIERQHCWHISLFCGRRTRWTPLAFPFDLPMAVGESAARQEPTCMVLYTPSSL
jgi:hypothetical protein